MACLLIPVIMQMPIQLLNDEFYAHFFIDFGLQRFSFFKYRDGGRNNLFT